MDVAVLWASLLAAPPIPSVSGVPVAATRGQSRTLADKVQAGLRRLKNGRDVELVCGSAPLCVADRIYYDKASVDSMADLALDLVPGMLARGRHELARQAILNVKLAKLYSGEKLIPARTRLYPAAEVDEQVAAVLALLP